MNTFKYFNSMILSCIDFLLLRNPEKTILGIMLGLVCFFLTVIFKPVIINFHWLNLKDAPGWGWIPLGITAVNLPSILCSLFKKPLYSEEVDEISRVIDKGDFSEAERRQIYRRLVGECIKNITLNKKINFELIKRREELTKLLQNQLGKE
ncbi:MAG: hypothetical protein ABIK12_09740 [Pseudomonadota bacterium]